MLKEYIMYLLEPTLLLSLLFGLLGFAAALHFGHANALYGTLAIIGVVLAQMSVNVIDDYIDYRKGIDRESVKTKFSGGSTILLSGKMKPRTSLAIGLGTAAIGGAMGIYLAYFNPVLLPLIAVGALSVFFYPSYIVKIPYLAEADVMLSFVLIAFGCYIAASGPFASIWNAAFAFIPIGMLGGITLYVNSVPDRQVDRRHGRRSMVVMFGKPGRIGRYYLLLEGMVYGLIAVGIGIGSLPVFFLLTFLTMPVVYRVFNGMSTYKSPRSYERYMGLSALGTFTLSALAVFAFII